MPHRVNKGGNFMNTYETFDNYNYDNDKAFEIVETTSSLSGYPENLKWALTGFPSWDDAEDAAKALDGEIISLRRRDGQQLWTRDGRVFEPYTRTPVSDDEEIIPGGESSAAEFWESESAAIAGRLEDGVSVEDFARMARKAEKIYKAINDASEEEGVLISMSSNYLDVVDLRPMEYHDSDVTAYQIAVILCG